MVLNMKLIISTILSVLFLLQGCSSGGGGSSSSSGDTGGTGGGGTDIPVVSVPTVQTGLFSIGFENNSTEIFDYTLSIKRDGVELSDTLLEYISHEKGNDGSIVITLKQVDTDGTKTGLTALALGDIILLEASGYTPQQFIVDETMLNNASNKIALKAVESRQTYNLSDMTSGADTVAPRSARGATTRVTDEGVVFETLGSGISLTMPKMTYERLVRKISRLPRSSATTQVYIDMTSIDPRTEHSATIGDFSYDAASEPVGERSTNAVDDSPTALESVVMADMRMTTDSGDEIHCFDGEYDPATNSCSGDATATLKMQIPESQFQQYAQKYNEGDRVVPLYSYSKEKATWVRQVGADGKGVDSELVLTDNNGNQKADEGDVLALVGQVGHFSYWNGDYAMENTCLNVPLDLSAAPDAAAYVQVKGVDYTGRIFKKYISSSTTEITNITAKANAIVSIELIMSDGSVGDSITYATGASSRVCEDVNETLVAPTMDSLTLGVIVKDREGNPLKGASLRSAGKYAYTDVNGTAEFTYAYQPDTNLSETITASYNTGSFRATAVKDITQDSSGPIIIELDIAETTFSGSVVETVDGETTVAANAYVRIYNYNPYYSQSVNTDSNGKFEIKLPSSIVQSDSTATIYIHKYNREYAFYPKYTKEIGLDVANPTLGEFKLAFDTYEVSGQVSDTLGEPISSASVYARGGISRYTRSDENGNYEFTLLGDFGDNGTNFTLQANTYKEGYHYSEKAPLNAVSNGTTNQDFTIDLRKATIKGRVLTSKGIALSNMRVYWSRDYYNYALTDEEGYFSLESYNGGDGVIRVYDASSHKYLDFDADTNVRDVILTGVAVGEIYDLENLLAVEQNFAPIINEISINPSTPLVDTPFTITVDAYDPDGDDINYTIKEYYNRGSVSVSGNVATATPNSTSYYYYTVTATDSNKNTTQKRVSVYVKNHARPVIDSVTLTYPNNKSYFDKSSDLNVSTSAYSAEGNSLTYTYNLVSLNAANEDVVLSNADANTTIGTTVANGRYRLDITVSDAYNETTTRRYITVDNSVAPEIASFTMNSEAVTTINIKQNKSVSFYVNLSSANVTTPTWYWYVNGKTYSTKNIADVTFNKEGYFYGYVIVRDASGRSDSQSFYINVQEDAKPIIDSISVTPSTITKVGDTYRDASDNNVTDLALSVSAHDIDSDSLKYTFATLGDTEETTGNDNNATYPLSGLAVGKHSIKVTVSDVTSSVVKYLNIEILEDSPPVITEFRVPLNAKVSETIELYADATEPNGQALTYKWSATAGTVTNDTTKNASLKVPSSAQDINVTLTVSDGSNEVSRVRTVNVLANQAPVIEYFTLRTASITLDSQTIELKSIYGDVDGTITEAKYIVKDASRKVVAQKVITQSNIVTSWELALESAGTYSVYLEVTDNQDANATSESATLIVAEPNRAPVITSLTATSTNLLVSEVATLNVVATDADADAISISWSTTDGASIVKDATAQDRATFSASSAGTYTITAIATDAGGLKAIKTLEIKVQSASLSISSDKTSYTLGEDVSLTAAMSSEHTLSSATAWSVIAKPDSSTLTTTSTGASIVLTPDVAGTYKVKAETTINGVDFSAEYSFSVSVPSSSDADLEGVVTSDSGDTLSGAKVRLYNKTDASLYDVTVTTDSSGAYSFSDVVAGSYYLVVYAGNGYISQTQVVEIK